MRKAFQNRLISRAATSLSGREPHFKGGKSFHSIISKGCSQRRTEACCHGPVHVDKLHVSLHNVTVSRALFTIAVKEQKRGFCYFSWHFPYVLLL